MKRILFLFMAVLLSFTVMSQTKTVLRLDVDVGSKTTLNTTQQSFENTTVNFDVPITVQYTPVKTADVYMFQPVSNTDMFATAVKMEQTDAIFEMNNQNLWNQSVWQSNQGNTYNVTGEGLTRLDIGELFEDNYYIGIY